MSKENKNLKASKSNERFWSNYKTMLLYCLKCRKSTEKKTREFWKSEKKGKSLWNATICGSKKLRFIKEQEASGSLSSLRTKMVVEKVSIVGPILF